MKREEKQKAIKLRKEHGLSINEIARKLNISKGTSSLWLRDIEISEEHKHKLILRNPAKCKKASKVWQDKCREDRVTNQYLGRKMAKGCGSDFAFGIALYAGEGDKSRNIVSVSNTDIYLIRSFFNFVNNNFNVDMDEWTVTIHCYSNNGISIPDIEKYWIDGLNLKISNLRKTLVKNKYYDGNERHKYPYGVCRISLYRTDIKQQIFGAIKELVGDTSDRWID